MRNFLEKLLVCLAFALLTPFLLMGAFIYLLYVPFDIIKYHKMPYYRNIGKKYEFFITLKPALKLYNRMVSENIPMEYFSNGDYEYFVKDGFVLHIGWAFDTVTKAEDEWFFGEDFCSEDCGDDEEFGNKISLKAVLEEDSIMLLDEHRSLPAKYIYYYGDIDGERLNELKECPYLYLVHSDKEFK